MIRDFNGRRCRFLNQMEVNRVSEGARMRVLLIEDEPVTAEALALMLAGERCSTDKTGSGEEGIALAKIYDYDIILLDLSLPDMTGYDVMVILRAANVTTPVLVVSG